VRELESAKVQARLADKPRVAGKAKKSARAVRA